MHRQRTVLAVVLALATLAASCANSDTDIAVGAVGPGDSGETLATDTSDIDPRKIFDAERRLATPDTPARYTVGFYGDSFAHSAAEHVNHFLWTGGRLEVVGGVIPGAAICDYLPQIARDTQQHDMFAAILVFSANSFTSCMAKPNGRPLQGRAAIKKFTRDLRKAVKILEAAGVKVYLGTIPESRGEVLGAKNFHRSINRKLRRVAAKHPNTIVVDAAAAVLDENGDYTETLPCLPNEPCTGGSDDDGNPVNLVRQPDGTHFCSGGYGPGIEVAIETCPVWSSGAFRYAGALTGPVVADAQQEWVKDHPPVSGK